MRKPQRSPAKVKPPALRKTVKGKEKVGGSGIPFEATRDQRLLVECLVANGCTQDMVAEELGICKLTLLSHFRKELDDGMARIKVRIGSTIAQQALRGCVKSQRLFMDRRGGKEWMPRQAHEHSGPDGRPIQNQDVANLSADELEALAKLYKGDNG